MKNIPKSTSGLYVFFKKEISCSTYSTKLIIDALNLRKCVLFFPLISVQNSEFDQHVCFLCIHFQNKIN